MVKRFINFFGREVNGLHEAAYLLGFFAVLSQVLALIRDRLLASGFGAGDVLDLYYAAFRIPDFLFVAVASLFSASIIIPFLSERVGNSRESGREFLSAAFSVFLLAMVVVSAVTFIFTPWLIRGFFPGFSTEPLRGDLILMTRILLLSPIFLGLSNLLASVTQLYNRFFIYAVSPLLYNVGIIAGVLFFAPRLGPVGLVWGAALGAALHFLVQTPFVIKRGLFPKLVFSFKKYRDIAGVMLVAIPRTFALSTQEVSKFFLIALASVMGAGSISVFSLSQNLQSVPLSIIGVSYSLAAFPALSTLFATGQRERFVELVRMAARYIIFFSIPLTVLLIVLRAHFVRVVLGAGAFNWQDTRLTAAALALFVVSLSAQGLILLFTRARYAAGNTKVSFYINVGSAGLTVITAYFLSWLMTSVPGFRFFVEALFRVEDVSGTVILALPIAFSLGGIFGALGHILTFNRDCGRVAKELGRLAVHLFIVAVVMGFAAYMALNLTKNFFSPDTFMGVLTHGFIAGVSGIGCGIILLSLSGSRELKEVLSALRRKFWKTPVIGPDPNAL